MSVDNAGTGTGRFDFLREVNADILKIDGSLVNGASDDIVSRALINGLVHMADTLGMRTVAGQVDTTGKLRAVTQFGVDYAQGYPGAQARAHRLVRVPRLRHSAPAAESERGGLS